MLFEPEDQDPSHYYGIVKVDILPPFALYNPVLLHRHKGKLTFPLCCTCVEEKSALGMLERSYYCTHMESQRMLHGTWCTSEILKAVEMGYRVLHIHEVWHFPEDQRQTGLLAPYVNDWLKIKQESSGRPSWTSWDPKKENEYIRNYEEREGILFKRTKIAKNPSRKATAKLMLNSFWGKFGEIMNKMKTVQCTQAHELLALLNNPLINISTVRILSSEFLEVAYMRGDEETDKGTKTNILIAAFTTCQARLKLYESLEVLGDRVLYYDTDSVIYTWKPGQSEIPL